MNIKCFLIDNEPVGHNPNYNKLWCVSGMTDCVSREEKVLFRVKYAFKWMLTFSRTFLWYFLLSVQPPSDHLLFARSRIEIIGNSSTTLLMTPVLLILYFSIMLYLTTYVYLDYILLCLSVITEWEITSDSFCSGMFILLTIVALFLWHCQCKSDIVLIVFTWGKYWF